MNMQSKDLPTFSGVQVKWPEAAAPHSTPQISGTHVTGLVSCRRIFQMSSVLLPPRTPSSWRIPSFFPLSAFSSAFFAASSAAAETRNAEARDAVGRAAEADTRATPRPSRS